MSQNINQIYIANPATSMQANDLYYLGRSPYGTSSDFAIHWSDVMASITTVSTITTGVWNGSIVTGAYGGTGVNNGASTITLGGSLTTVGAYASTFTMTGATSVTFPTSGTLATTGQVLATVTIAGTSQAAAVNTIYIVGNASQTTITLPATAAAGSIIGVTGNGAGGWILAANTGQTIKVVNQTTSSAGSLTSAEQYDCTWLMCVVANTTWVSMFANTSGFTYA